MSQELKALLSIAFNLYQIVAAVINKQSIIVAIVGQITPLISNVTAASANWSDLNAEWKALGSSPAADADLLAFMTTLVGSGTKAALLVGAVGKFVEDGVVDISAVVAAVKA